MGNESAIRIAERVIEAINERNRDAIEELAHPEVQLRMPPAMVFYGPDGVHQFFDELESRLPDLTVTADAIHAGDEFAVVEWEASGHTAAQDEDEEMGALVLQMHEGRIRRAHLYLDLERWQKLGALKGA